MMSALRFSPRVPLNAHNIEVFCSVSKNCLLNIEFHLNPKLNLLYVLLIHCDIFWYIYAGWDGINVPKPRCMSVLTQPLKCFKFPAVARYMY